MTKTNISVVMPFYKKYEFLPQTLPPLLKQLEPQDEVIYLCDGDLPYLKEIIETSYVDDRISIEGYSHRKPDDFRVASLFNIGYKLARNDFVIQLSPDCLVSDGWRNNMVKYLAKRRVLIGQMNYHYIDDSIRKDPRLISLNGENYVLPKYLWGGNYACHVDDYWAVGGHDEAFDGSWGYEDNMLGTKMLVDGCVFYYIKNANITHLYHPITNRDTSYNAGRLFLNLARFYHYVGENWSKIYGKEITMVNG